MVCIALHFIPQKSRINVLMGWQKKLFWKFLSLNRHKDETVEKQLACLNQVISDCPFNVRMKAKGGLLPCQLNLAGEFGFHFSSVASP